MDPLQSLIEKFWAGTASREERKQLLDRLNSGEEELKKRMRLQFQNDITPKKKFVPLTWQTTAARWLAAAVIFIAAVAPALLWQTSRRAKHLTAAAKTTTRMDTVFNWGSKALAVATSDGSRIILYPGSSIRFPDSFDTVKREVFLDGKALFTVARDIHRPFTVLAPGLTTAVLGTTFLVNSGPSGDSWVQLYEGSVKVRYAAQNNDAQEVLLKPGEQVLAHSGSTSLVVSPIHSAPEAVPGLAKTGSSKKTSKPDDRIEFRQEPLATIFTQLGKRYHTRIVFNTETVKGLVFTGSFARDKDLPSIILLITNLNNLKVTPQGDSLIITK